ncbi:Major facilitator superfamily domain, general substrate transporter [Cordyceps fumosorosea ARSEF 2679]|uniref:Major facilitator superfamily domain, general substrate transporter n=1 Tax=Cordyceps fumosorosea (strain ARSEF 2679) TaxID=1081104 RepID=A0A162N0L4_CORFA|nr:Major facilitator superfamily domain, general substrate transporter [Cordyceps fumosorosea ARSEF 2679]OAA73619.1 Major facilitator superfamily domain, general substrate transporter [Cordyceps fumosorosea ARSEF 2679]
MSDPTKPPGPLPTITTPRRPPEFEVLFRPGDPSDPQNWPSWYRMWAILTVAFSAWVVILFSTSYTGALPALIDEFHVSRTHATLGLSTYLLGLALGSLVVAPLSELLGRRIVYLVGLALWAAFIIPCGVAQCLTTILVNRFISAIFGAALICNGPGTVVDVSKPDRLAMGMSLFSLGPFNGPVLGPLIGGLVFEYLGWRWTNWIVLILAGVAFSMMLTIHETYAPRILRQRAAKMRKETGDDRWWCRYDDTAVSWSLFATHMKRPLVLFFTEPIVWFINVWNALIYGILYLCFVAYPVVFMQHRGWTVGFAGMSYLGIGVGIVLAIAAEPLARRIIHARPPDPLTGKPPPEAAALLMVAGALLTPIGQLGFAWTCLPARIHWVIPLMFGVPFGFGNTLSFIYSSNYLAGAYGIYAASALASNAVIRSIFGATLPLAGTRMYQDLDPRWAGTICGLLAVGMIPVPFVFWRYGAAIRARSRVIRQLREQRDAMEASRAEYQAKQDDYSSSNGQLASEKELSIAIAPSRVYLTELKPVKR